MLRSGDIPLSSFNSLTERTLVSSEMYSRFPPHSLVVYVALFSGFPPSAIPGNTYAVYTLALEMVGATALYALGLTSTANTNTMRGGRCPQYPMCSSPTDSGAAIKKPNYP